MQNMDKKIEYKIYKEIYYSIIMLDNVKDIQFNEIIW